ncbi:MAG: four helix bundle protein [candidate division Zixibacteria bacterium]|nr:four helix bundle protein [candidate division Zixibacteria bacterium]
MKNHNSKPKTDTKKRAYLHALEVIKFLDQLPKHDLSCQVIAKQLIRSSTSIGANIIEAHASSSKKEFTNFFHHSLKSANESKFWLCLLRDSGKVKKGLVKPLLAETEELAKILASSILTLKGKKKFV